MIENPTVNVDVDRLLRRQAVVTVTVRPTRAWRACARLWVATQLWRLGTWVARQEFKVAKETQP